MDAWDDIIRGTLLVLSHSASLALMSEPRPSIRHPLVFWISVSAVAEVLICGLFLFQGFTFGSGGVAYFILLIIYLLDFLYVSSGPLARNLFSVLMYMTFFMLAASVANILGRVLFGGSDVAIALIRTCFSIAFIILYPLRIRKPFHKATDDIDKGWGVLIFFEIISLSAISILSFIGAFMLESPMVYLVLLTLMSFLLISAYCVVIRMVGMLNERNAMQALIAQQGMLEAELEAERDAIETTRRYRHDLKQHGRVLMEYISEGKSEEALSYLNELDVYIDASAVPDYCENSVLNALLRINARRIAEIGGTFSFKASVPEDLPCSSIDLAVIFGNLLENAYEASRKTRHPSVEIRASVRNGSLRAEIRNSMTGCVRWKDDLPVTTKEHGGTGLRNVVLTLGKYGGMLSTEQDGGFFIARVIMPLEK